MCECVCVCVILLLYLDSFPTEFPFKLLSACWKPLHISVTFEFSIDWKKLLE